VESDIWVHKTNKMDTLFRMIGEHPKEKSLVFCQFMEEMKYIEQGLANLGHEVFRIDGSVDQADRVSRIAKFKVSAWPKATSS
jgi:superfamily II DNA/RNA helicase